MSPTAQLADKVSGFLGSRFSRRGFFARSAVVGSAVAANPLTYALTPTDAYAAVCSCSGSNCECGSTCCDGYTEFCCTLTGNNQCPPGSLLGGWWKVDGSGFCNGPRYYMDCNAPCNGCGCGGGGICSGGCSGTNCGCGLGDCNNRKAGCVNFRYGQCNQQVSCIGPILCRVVTCIAPWEIDGTCTTTARYDANTAYHDRPCLHGQTGSLDLVAGGGATGSASPGGRIDWDTNGPITVRVTVDGQVVATPLANLARSDIANAYPGMGPNHGFDVDRSPQRRHPHRLRRHGERRARAGLPARLPHRHQPEPVRVARRPDRGQRLDHDRRLGPRPRHHQPDPGPRVRRQPGHGHRRRPVPARRRRRLRQGPEPRVQRHHPRRAGRPADLRLRHQHRCRQQRPDRPAHGRDRPPVRCPRAGRCGRHRYGRWREDPGLGRRPRRLGTHPGARLRRWCGHRHHRRQGPQRPRAGPAGALRRHPRLRGDRARAHRTPDRRRLRHQRQRPATG